MARPDLFDTYFQRADLDRDGKISGGEAVSFFQGANLPKPVLAQIWMHADQKGTGFLGRTEFYNALKLVTVAQSGRELTPDLVKAALFGPASSQIPPPVIGGSGPSAATPAAPTQPSSMPAGASVSAAIPPSGASVSQSRPGVAPPYTPPVNNQFIRPQPFPRPSLAPSVQGPAMPTPASGAASVSQLPVSRFGQSSGLGPANNVPAPVSSVLMSNVQQPNIQPRASSSLPTKPEVPAQSPDPFGSLVSIAPTSGSDNVKPGVNKSTPLDLNGFSSISTSMALVPTTLASTTPVTKPIQPEKSLGISMATTSVAAAPAVSGLGGTARPLWPKMTQSNVQRYTEIFSKVDTDRDGKISGQQARDLFLSWKLPREILKQIWDLSDQDDDSMLSLREFCIALYLMERFREGRPLPQSLPPEIGVDEALRPTPALQNASQRTLGPNGIPWQPTTGTGGSIVTGNSGMPSQTGRYNAAPPNMGVYGQTPRGDVGGIRAVPNDGTFQSPRGEPFSSQFPSGGQVALPKSRTPVLEPHLVGQLPLDDQETLKSRHKNAMEAEKKVNELEKDIMDAKEKIDFYRTKLQELILYKTRCDNRINEITERAAADKREVEAMSKKYEEKYKQTGESNTRLASEEAAFKDLQERKLELYNAIVRIEQGGKGDSLLQVRADRIQADLEELWKTLKERCKQLGLKTKPTAVMELPYGWQPGIQESSAEWDDDWDKFDDEGFTIVNELVSDEPAPKRPVEANSDAGWEETSAAEEEHDLPSSSNTDAKSDNLHSSEQVNGNGNAYAHSEDGSPRSVSGSPHEKADKKTDFDDIFTSGKEKQSIDSHGDIFGDSASWDAAFTSGVDEGDSFWGTNNKSAVETHKSSFDRSVSGVSMDHGRHLDNPQFDSLDSINIRSLKISSPRVSRDHDDYDAFGTIRTKDKQVFAFDNSVPSTPLYNTASPGRHSNLLFNSASPGKNSNAGSVDDHNSHFDSFSKFDTFNARDSGIFSTQDTFGSFDTFNAKDSGHNTAFDSFSVKDTGNTSTFDSFSSFNAKDPVNSSFDSFNSFKSKDGGQTTSFDSFNSFKAKDAGPSATFDSFDSFKSKDAGHSRGFTSFDDSDPFGSSGPFALEGQTPRHKSSEGWNAF